MAVFCRDCKHLITDEGQEFRCGHPNNTVETVDEAKYLVTGIEQPVTKALRGATCKALRLRRAPDMLVCGPDGDWFELKSEA